MAKGPKQAMNRVILHAGLGKTGTTTIQATLAANRAALAPLGVAYPGVAEAHHDLVGLFHPGGTGHFWFRNRDMDADAARAAATTQMDAVADAARTGVPVIVLSSEYLHRMPAPHLTEMEAQVAALGYQLETLCFIREPVALTASRIGQAVRMGTSRLDQMLAGPYQAAAMAQLRPALQVLGRARVHVRKMEEMLATGLTRAVLEVAGVTPPPDLEDMRQNTGLCHDAIYLMDAVNAIDDPERHLARQFIHRFIAMEGARFTLPPDVARRIVTESRAEQAFLQNRFQLSYAPPDIPEGAAAPGQMARAAREVAALTRTRRALPGWLRLRRGRSG